MMPPPMMTIWAWMGSWGAMASFAGALEFGRRTLLWRHGLRNQGRI
jgi:hypothetical protein